jgi:predicted HD superfamily hydrolase involved in NAD metabolism
MGREYNPAVGKNRSIEDYDKLLQQYLGNKRLVHSRAVADAARKLAQRFAPEHVERAELAGLLHDNAKHMNDPELIDAVAHYDIEITPGELEQPQLLHGKVGAAQLSERFGVDDPLVVSAVADHVTGRVGMGTLSLILFVADQIADDRDFPGLVELRHFAMKDLYRAAFMVSQYKLQYIVKKERPIEGTTVAVYNELLRRVSANGEG